MSEEKEDTYAADGVDVKEGDSFSAVAGEVCRGTYENSPFVDVLDLSGGHFRGPRSFRIKNLPEGWSLDAATDGSGTKVVVTDAAMAHAGAACDVVAMTSGDITRWGGKPLVFVNVLDVSTLDKKGTDTNNAFRTMIGGLGKVAAEQGIVCLRGETAELGVCVGSDNPDALTKFNWAGCMIGAYLPDRIITGDSLAPGQWVMALEEIGFRSNGLSSVRAAFVTKFGKEWWKNPTAKPSIAAAATPSTLYDKLLAHLNGWEHPIVAPKLKMHAIIHVTGGGIVGKFGEDILFPRGLSAKLDSLYEPPGVMQDVIDWRGMSEVEAYRRLTCGNGALVVIDERDAEYFAHVAWSHGLSTMKAGEITETPAGKAPMLSIRSGFRSGDVFEYDPPTDDED